MNELTEKIMTPIKNLWAEFQESSIYNNFKEKFDELPPTGQKLVLVGGVVVFLLVFLMNPLMDIQTASTEYGSFLETKDVLRDLNRLGREQAQAPNLPPSPSAQEISSEVSRILGEAGLNQDQIAQNAETAENTGRGRFLPKNIQQKTVTVALKKLNLKQIVDIGHNLQKIRSSHLMDMEVRATAEDVHYFDVMFRVVALHADGGTK